MTLPDVVADWFSGTLTVLGRRAVVLGVPSLVELAKVASNDPPDLRGLAFAVGRATGKELAAACEMSLRGKRTQGEWLDAMMEVLRRAGWGDIRIVRADWSANRFAFAGRNLPTASASRNEKRPGQPSDRIVVGMLAGVGEAIVRRPLDGEESSCEAMGASECSIAVFEDVRASPGSTNSVTTQAVWKAGRTP